MADNFKGLSKETLASALEIKNSMKDIGMATQDLNKLLQSTSGYLVNVSSEFNKISNAAGKVADLQEQARRSSAATQKAFVEQGKQLSIVKSLNIQIDDLYRAASKETKTTKFNLEKQAQNLAAARDNAQALADNFKSIAESSAELDSSTEVFSLLAEIMSSTPLLKTFSGPFEAAAEASRKQVLENAKSLSIKERISKVTAKELATGKGLTKQRIQDLGLQDIVGSRAGISAANLLKTAQATAKTQSAGMAGLLAGFKALSNLNFKALGSLLGKEYIKAATTADERTTSIAKNLSIGKEAADGVYSNLKSLKGTLDSSLQSTKKIVDAFNDLSELSDFSFIATKNQVDAQISLTKEIGVSKEAALGYQSAVAVSNIDAKKGLDIVYDQIAAFANQNKIVADGRKIFDQINKTSKLIQLNFRGNFDSLVKTTLQANKLGLSLDQVSKVGESLLNFEQSISSELEAELLTGRDLNLEKARLFALNHDIAGLTQEIANQGITAEKFTAMNVIQQEAIAKTLGMQASSLGEALYNQKLIEQTAGSYTKELRNQAEQLKKSNNTQNIGKAIELEKRAAAIENGILQGKSLEQAQKSVTVQEQYADALEQAKELFSDLATGGYLETLVDGFKVLIGFIKTFGAIIDIAVIKPLNIVVNLAMAAFQAMAALVPGSGVTMKDAKESYDFAKANFKDMGVNTGNLLGVTDQKNTYTKQILNNNPNQANPSSYENKDSAETNKLLNELISATKAGGNVIMSSTAVGHVGAMNTFSI
jgi:hypothetical protein